MATSKKSIETTSITAAFVVKISDGHKNIGYCQEALDKVNAIKADTPAKAAKVRKAEDDLLTAEAQVTGMWQMAEMLGVREYVQRELYPRKAA